MVTFFRELFRVDIYKRTQGRITRQVTFAGLAVALAAGLWKLSIAMTGQGMAYQYGLPGLLLLATLWGCYRVVNVPGFADFLIAVEAEMNKVSWPTRPELFRASLVVLLLIFSLASSFSRSTRFWGIFFRWTGVL